MRPRRPPASLTRQRLAAYGFSLPATACTLWLLTRADLSEPLSLTLGVGVVVLWLAGAAWLVEHWQRPLQTAANLISAVREGDFSIRAKRGRRGDPLGDLNAEINLLASILRRHRLHAIEATALVTAVMEAIDVAVMAFDEAGFLRLANPAAERLMGRSQTAVLGRSASELALASCLEGEPVRVLVESPFPQHPGSWGLRRCSFREEGRPHTLVLLADLSQTLRAEQTKAWQSLVRVLGHELNNSLTPIKSIAGSLGTLLRREPRPADLDADLRSGLDVIASRADGLARFMQAYSSLAKLPPPQRTVVPVQSLIDEAVVLETRVACRVDGGPALELDVDASQVGQVLTNLLKNAAESVLAMRAHEEYREEPRGVESAQEPLSLSWRAHGSFCEIVMLDRGLGIANPSNLFVPFFTTKEAGSGIGLVLSRQIAENHGGSLFMANREEGSGCRVVLRLPLFRRS